MSSLPFFYSDRLLGYDMGPEHPLQPIRLKMTRDLLDAYGAFDGDLEIVEPTPATYEELAETHSPEYLDAILRIDGGDRGEDLRSFGFGAGDNPIFPDIFGASALYTGASADAAQAVVDGSPVAFSISGGLHHAHYDRAAGFCVLNDCAVGIRRLRKRFARVAYVDIDVHHGDGVQELFYADPNVLTVSLHESGRTLFPGTGDTSEIGTGPGEGYSVNLPFASYTIGETWLEAWRASALPILRAFDPGAILLQCGTDTHLLDPLAHLCLTAQDWLEAVKDVQALGKPIAAVGGGGYNRTTVPRMWTLMIAQLAGFDVSDVVPPNYAWSDVIPYLTDHETPVLDDKLRERTRAFANRSVEELKRLLFARHGVS